MLYQQGDVLIQKIKKLPINLKRVQSRNGENVLAEGEVTGHYHGIDDGTTALLEDGSGSRYLSVNMASVLTHQEHKPITLPPGAYSVRQVMEYDHFAEEARKVQD